jgi:hypothetical protein
MFRGLIPIVLLATLAACGGVTDPSQNQTQTFNTTIQPGGVSDALPFNASKSGEITISVTSMNPTLPSGTFFSVVWGQVISGQCGTISVNSLAVVGATAISSAITPGSYCVAVADTYNAFKTAEQVTVSVSHP